MKNMHFSSIILALIVIFTSPVNAQSLSADDFLPPVQAASPEQEQTLSEVQGSVTEVDDPEMGQVVEAETTQDAINYLVNQRSAGAEMIRVGSGIGWVATGIAGYEALENPTATRIGKRNAYVRAFLEAQKNLAETLNGLSSEGKTLVADQLETVTDAQADLTNFSETQEEKLEQAVQMLLRGFVVYAVEDDTANQTVMVSIVTTPKTRGKFNRPGSDGLEASSIRDGLSQVLLEIEQGLVPPIGGRMIQVPTTGEMAFIGFGSDVVRTSSNPTIQRKQQLNAAKIAGMRASDALVGMIIGDDTRWKSKLDETTQQAVSEFEQSEIAEGEEPSRQRFEQARQSFTNTQVSSEEFQSLRRGVLPPGVTRKTFSSADNAEMYAVAVYIPSLSAQAGQAAAEMQDAQLLSPPGGTGGQSATKSSSSEGVRRPSTDVAPGPTGQVSRDQDL